jgi:hypothetical protein
MSEQAQKGEFKNPVTIPWITNETFSNVKEICAALIISADEEGFFDLSPEDMKRGANRTIDNFTSRNRLVAHTVRPLSWSFEVKGEHMYEDGLIEFHVTEDGQGIFSYVDVSDSKITLPDESDNQDPMLRGKGMSTRHAYTEHLKLKLEKWKSEISHLKDKELNEAKSLINSAEDKLEEFNNSAEDKWKGLRQDAIELWKKTENSVKKLKDSVK